jgi:hypothetical protein
MAGGGECSIQVLRLQLGERRGWGSCIHFGRGRGALAVFNSTRGRWSDGMARRPEAVATVDFSRGRPEEGDEVGWAVLGWLGLKAN